MGAPATKAQDNIYYVCRKKASTYNDKLLSREGAAELIGVSASSMADYELGNTKVVPVDKVNLMAEVYGAPELRNWYCANECPLGVYTRAIKCDYPERTALRLHNVLSEVQDTSKSLCRILDDGEIDDTEKRMLPAIKEQLIEAKHRIEETLAMLEKTERSEYSGK